MRFGFFIVVIFLSLGSAAYAQPDDDSYPPPPRVIPKDEKTRLDAEPDVRRRTRLALELMEMHLKHAEDLHAIPEFEGMFRELGIFHGVADNTLEFLTGSDKDNDKVLNNLKKFEISLRSYVPRLEIIRRDLPFRYEFYVRRLAIFLRDARAKAVEPLFSNTVVPSKKPSR